MKPIVRQQVLREAMVGADRLIFLQLSDFHYGHAHFTKLRASDRLLLCALNDHDPKLCRALAEAVGTTVLEDLSVPARVAELPLVFTGDLTATGHAAECQAAREFVAGGVADPARRGSAGGSGGGSGGGAAKADATYGLGRGDWFAMFTPGNHDQWGGARSGRRTADLTKAVNPPARNPHLFDTPFLVPRAAASVLLRGWGNIPAVRVFGADSNAGFDATETNPMAEGRLGPELDRLRGELVRLRDEFPAVIGAVAVHHRLPNHRWPPELAPYPLNGPDADALLALGAEFGVQAILTGHQHSFWHTVSPDQPPPYELRAATPVQATGGPRPDHHGFTAHVLVRAEGLVYWVAIAYQMRAGVFERWPFDFEVRESVTNPYPPMFLVGGGGG